MLARGAEVDICPPSSIFKARQSSIAVFQHIVRALISVVLFQILLLKGALFFSVTRVSPKKTISQHAAANCSKMINGFSHTLSVAALPVYDFCSAKQVD